MLEVLLSYLPRNYHHLVCLSDHVSHDAAVRHVRAATGA